MSAHVSARSTVTGLMVTSDAVSDVGNSQTAPNRSLTGKVHNLKVVARFCQGAQRKDGKVTARFQQGRRGS